MYVTVLFEILYKIDYMWVCERIKQLQENYIQSIFILGDNFKLHVRTDVFAALKSIKQGAFIIIFIH